MRVRHNRRLRYEKEHVACDRCGFTFLDGELLAQDGYLVCPACFDEEDYQGPQATGGGPDSIDSPNKAGQDATKGAVNVDSLPADTDEVGYTIYLASRALAGFQGARTWAFMKSIIGSSPTTTAGYATLLYDFFSDPLYGAPDWWSISHSGSKFSWSVIGAARWAHLDISGSPTLRPTNY